jgi:hypothetical protein
MIVSMIGLMVTSIIQTNAQSKIGEDCPNFQPCLDDGDLYKTSTCGPLQARNVSWYNTCLCLNTVNIGLCYNQCTSDPEAVTQGKAFQATITARCSAVNIDPKGPYPPAPWVNGGVVVTPTTSISEPARAPNATSTAAVKNNAQKLSSLAGIILLFLS